MQQDNWQELDHIFRSELADAEVKAPRHAWRAISGRLDKEAAAAALAASHSRGAGIFAGRSWWQWAGLSMAAVAAIALGVFFGGRIGNADSVNGLAVEVQQGEGVFAQAQEPLVSIDDIAVPELDGEPQAYVPKRVVARQSDQQLAHEMVEAIKAQVDGVQEPSRTEDADRTGETAGQKEAENASSAAYWAQIEREESLSRRVSRMHRGSLYAQGGLGGNDAASLFTGKVSHMAPGKAPQTSTTISESENSIYGVPFSVGLGARFYLTDKFSLGAGLNYSLLTRTFSGVYQGSTGDILNTVQYVGVPVNAYYDILSLGDGSMSFYAYAGGEIEKCISNKFHVLSGNAVVSEAANGFQYSAALGIGAEFQLSRHVGLYVDPGIKYYFPCGQPKSIRTEKPLMISFEAGLHFNL